MSKLFVMIGLPGSGKSVEARKIAEAEDAEVVSSDEIRLEINGNETDQDNTGKVFEVARKRLKAALISGQNVIMDSTNISYKRRMALLSEMRKYASEMVAVLMATPFEMCIERQNLRERKVETDVITRMYHNFYVPWYCEGWDKIRIIYPEQHYLSYATNHLSELLNGTSEFYHFDQKSLHHKLTLGHHMNACYECVSCNTDDSVLCSAAMLHDIGKAKTQTFDENGVAHYYQHHCVSAYDSLFEAFNFYETEDKLLRAAYIQWHMAPYFWKEAKTEQKYRKLWGDEFFEKLMILHEGDIKAH